MDEYLSPDEAAKLIPGGLGAARLAKTGDLGLRMDTKSGTRKRALTIAGRKTSISLEEGFWRGLVRIAHDRETSVSEIVREIASTNPENLSSAVRVFVLNYYLRTARDGAASIGAV